MATEAQLRYVITAQDRDLQRLKKELRDLDKQIGDSDGPDKLSAKLTRTGDRMQALGKKASMFLTVPLAAGAVASLKLASDVDKGLREVNTLLGGTGDEAEKNFGRMQKSLADWSQQMGISQKVGVKGLYQAISAGVPKKNVFEFMTVAGKAAIAGNTDVETSIDGLTTYLNAFGLEAKESTKVADSMFQAVKDGKTDFESLSKSAFNVAPAAAAAKVSFQEVNAAISTLTASGTPTSVATTQIRAALVGLQKPSDALDKIFQKLGYQNAQTAIESKGLGFALDAVKKASKGNNGELQKLLGSTEAVSAVNVLAGTSAEKFKRDLENQRTAAGSVDTAFGEMEKSTARQMERLKVGLENLGISIGNILLPWLNRAVAVGQKVSGWLNGMSDGQRKVIVGLGLFLAALGPALIVTGKFVSALGAAGQSLKLAAAAAKISAAAQWLWNAALAANPLVLIIAGLVALGAALFVAYKKSETFRAIVDAAMSAVADAFGWVVDKGKALTGFFTKTLPDAAKAALSWVKSNWPAIATIISGPFAPLVALATDAWGIRSGLVKAFTTIKQWVSSNWPIIATIISGPFAPLVALATDAFGIRSALTNALRALMSTAGGWATRISSAIKTGFMTVAWDIPSTLFNRIIQPMIDKVVAVVDKAKALSAAIPRGFVSLTWGLVDLYKTRIIDPLVNLTDNALGKGKAIAAAIGRGIREGAGEVWDKVTDAFKGFLNRIIRVVNKVPFVDIPLLAQGGVIAGPTLAVVGEDGPEVVIPLGRKRRRRGVELMTQAASIMGMEGDWPGPVSRARGMGIPMLANGGFVVPGQYQGQGLDALYASMLRSQNNTSLLERAAGVLAKGVGWVLNQIPKPSFGNPVLDGLGKTVGSAAETAIKNAFGAAKKYNLDGISSSLTWARGVMGRPYVWGGGHGGWNYNLAGYDCSGFASHAAKKAGSSIGAPGTTMSLFPASAAGRGPVMFGFRGMGSNDPRRQHMGAKILSTWYQFGNPGHSGGGDGQWDSLRVPPGLASYQRGTPYVPQTGPALLHQGEKVVPREGSLVHIDTMVVQDATDIDVFAAGLSRKLALGGVG